MALELGVYGGAAFFNNQHNLQDLAVVSDTTTSYGHQRYFPGLDLGLRLGFYPLTFAGIEAEGGVIPTRTRIDKQSATIWTYRAHIVLQYPGYRLVPFVVLGAGGMSMRSHFDSLGNDSDPEWHWGLGAKFALSQDFTIRGDFRDDLMQKNRLYPGTSEGTLAHNIELLLGLSYTIGRSEANDAPVQAPTDSDGDGFADAQDACPMQPGVAPNGCPAQGPVDTDHDDIVDPSDACPTVPEDHLPPNPNDGCPSPDPDGDGILAPTDMCPTEKGVAPDGCPVRDKDGDGIPDAVDKCPDQPETKNGYQDADGCPDELPKAVAKFAGVIKGIVFDTGKATIRPGSKPVLDEAVKVLSEYKELKVMISGHTDNVGDHKTNQELSAGRAAAVKDYMVSKGIESNRIETRGAGSDEPIADNGTDKGRQENRRIEFKLISN